MGESISYKSIFDAHDKKLRDIVAADQEAKAMGQLVGRFYREQIADGYAFYVITKENKTKCKLVVVTGIGDDWTIPRFGEWAWVGKKEVLWNIGRRDQMDQLFKNTGVDCDRRGS
jgi:hypothetical protein